MSNGKKKKNPPCTKCGEPNKWFSEGLCIDCQDSHDEGTVLDILYGKKSPDRTADEAAGESQALEPPTCGYCDVPAVVFSGQTGLAWQCPHCGRATNYPDGTIGPTIS